MASEWLACSDLGVLNDVWAAAEVCKEAAECISEGGLLGGKHSEVEAQAWMKWVLGAAQEGKSASVSRLSALHILANSLPRLPRAVLLESWEKVLQLLRSALSPSSPDAWRRAACVCTVEAVRLLYSPSSSSSSMSTNASSEARQAMLEALPRLAAALLEVAGGQEQQQQTTDTATTAATALKSVSSLVRVLGVAFKPHASKAEAAAYRALDAPFLELRAAAAECLSVMPMALGDAQAWSAMLMGLVIEAGATLKLISPGTPVSSDLELDGSPRLPLPPLTPTPQSGPAPSQRVYAMQARRRLEGSVTTAAALLESGFSASAVVVPSSAVLALCEALASAVPRGASNLGSTPTALPATALQAVQPLLRSLSLRLVSSLLSAHPRGSSALRHLSRLSKLTLRALSWPAHLGLRPKAYALLSGVVLHLGAASASRLVEPCLPLVTHHVAGLLLGVDSNDGASSSSGAAKPALPVKRGKKRPKHGAEAWGNAVGVSPSDNEEKHQREPSVEASACTGLKALETILVCCGPVMTTPGRTAIDQLVGRGLLDLIQGIPRPGAHVTIATADERPISRLRTVSSIRAAFLELTSRVVLVQGPTGAGLSLVPLAAGVFNTLALDSDAEVCRAAVLGRAVTDSIMHPRACPLHIPPDLLRVDEEGGAQGGRSDSTNVAMPLFGAALLPRRHDHLGSSANGGYGAHGEDAGAEMDEAREEKNSGLSVVEERQVQPSKKAQAQSAEPSARRADREAASSSSQDKSLVVTGSGHHSSGTLTTSALLAKAETSKLSSSEVAVSTKKVSSAVSGRGNDALEALIREEESRRAKKEQQQKATAHTAAAVTASWPASLDRQDDDLQDDDDDEPLPDIVDEGPDQD